MEYRQLGTSELYVSRIGLGCMSLPPDERISIPTLQKAIDLGINFLDTADVYHNGLNESLIGKAIPGRRNNIILASKVGNVHRADGKGFDWNPTKKHILNSVDETLKRLQTDHLDLYQLHGGTIHDNIDETIEAFEILRQQGKIRYYGISSIRPNVIREYIGRSSMVSVMMQYSLLDRRPEETCLDLLQKNKIGVLVRGSVAQGLLIDKPPKLYLDHSSEDVVRIGAAVKKISGKERNATSTVVRYILAHPAITSAVIGIRTMDQLQDAVKTLDSPQLSEDEMIFLRRSAEAKLYKDHR